MAITKETEIGKMEVVTEYKHIQVRTDTVIKEDGKELSRTFHRHVIKPDISETLNIDGEFLGKSGFEFTSLNIISFIFKQKKTVP